MLHIAVVGSGASAISTIEAALTVDLEIQIDVFDPWFELPKHEESNLDFNPNQIAKKGRFGSLAMYRYPTESISVDSNLHIPLSGSVGGLTSVWGANSVIPDSQEVEAYAGRFATESIEWVTKYASIKNLNTIPDPEHFFISDRFRNLLGNSQIFSGIEITPASLSIHIDSCTKISGCLSGCKNQAIFSAEQEIYRLVRDGKVTLQKGFVQKIEQNQYSKFTLHLEVDGRNESNLKSYDKVFVTGGSIASCALLQRSGLMPVEIHLKDTQVFYSAYFVREKNIEQSLNFELSQIFLRRRMHLHISLYEFSSQFIHRARLIIGPLLKLVPKTLWNHIVAGIGFINSSESGYLHLEYRNSRTYIIQVPNAKSKKAIRKNMVAVRKSLKGVGFFHIPFLNKIPNVGASYHVGAANVGGEPLFSPNGKIVERQDLELYVLDSASLSDLPVGPITTTMMAAAYARAKMALLNE